MTDQDRKENFLRHAILVVDHCKEALTSLIECDLQLKKVTFEQFLNNNQHEIFHMCREKMCHCGTKQKFPQVFFRSQIELFFDMNLKSAKPGIAIDVLDMTLARCLLVNFCFDVFWHYNLQYQKQSLEDFVHAKKHTIYHLWQYNTRCCHCPTVFNTTLNFQKLDQTEWLSMFNVASPQPPCSMQAQANAFPCNSLCDYETRQTITLSSLNQKLQKTLLENCCLLRNSVETLVNIRNFKYGHAEHARMSDSDFEKNKKSIIEIILLIAKLCGKEPEVEAAIKVTLTDSLDHTLVAKYKELMSEIHQNWQHQNEKIQELEINIGETSSRVDETNKELGKFRKKVEEPVPPNIREQMKNTIKQWKKKDEDFVPTRASKHIFKCATSNACVTIIGPAGCGKTFLARHTALVLAKDGYDIIIIKTPKDIRDFYKHEKKTVFIVDDICGNFTARQEKIDKRKQFKDDVDEIVKDKNCRIIVSCRLQVYRDENFKCLSHFLSCECNLVSESLCLLPEEKAAMIKQYTGETIDTNIIDVREKLGTAGAFLPLLCSLYRKKSRKSALDFLQNPFNEITEELDTLSNRKEDSSRYKICSLALCVIFNNKLEVNWFKGKITGKEKEMLDDLSQSLGVGTLSKKSFKDEIDTLVGTFFIQQETRYKAIHDKVFDFLAWYFGNKITSCIIDHGVSDLIHERFRLKLEENDKCGDMEYIIGIPDGYLDQYNERMVTDWLNGKIIQVFNNINMRKQAFRQQFLLHLSQAQYNINHLLKKKDSSNRIDYKGHSDRTHEPTALIQSIKNDFIDMFKWLLSHNESNVNQTNSLKQSLLHFASMKGNLDILCTLLKNNADVNLCDANGRSPLWEACCKGNVEIVSKLLEKNPDVNLCENNGRSPLLVACVTGNVEIVSKLLENNPDVNLCEKDGRSPLWVACYNDNEEIVSKLLEQDPDVNLSEKDGRSPLWLACYNDNVEIVSKLLEKNPDVNLCNICGESPLWAECKAGNVEIVSKLLGKHPDVNICNEYGRSPLWIACNKGNVEIVSKLLEKNPDVNLCDQDGESPLWVACKAGYVEIVSKLLENNPNINLCKEDGQSPMWVACETGNVEIVLKLFEKNPDVNLCDEDGRSPLWVACYNDNVEIVSKLLERDPDVNLCDENGQSPLWIACNNDNVEIVSKLLEKNTDVNLCNNSGQSPLWIACDRGGVEIVSKLLEKDSDVNLCDDDGQSPLWVACYNDNVEIVLKLLERDPDVNLCDENGQSPLWIACNNNNVEIVSKLLEKNTDVNLCNNSGQSPLWIACDRGDVKIVSSL